MPIDANNDSDTRYDLFRSPQLEAPPLHDRICDVSQSGCAAVIPRGSNPKNPKLQVEQLKVYCGRLARLQDGCSVTMREDVVQKSRLIQPYKAGPSCPATKRLTTDSDNGSQMTTRRKTPQLILAPEDTTMRVDGSARKYH